MIAVSNGSLIGEHCRYSSPSVVIACLSLDGVGPRQRSSNTCVLLGGMRWCGLVSCASDIFLTGDYIGCKMGAKELPLFWGNGHDRAVVDSGHGRCRSRVTGKALRASKSYGSEVSPNASKRRMEVWAIEEVLRMVES